MQVRFLDLQKVNDSFGQELREAVTNVMASGWYLHGHETEAFEREFAEYTGVSHCVGVGNGLDALTLVLAAWKYMYGWSDGDEVIVPSNTFIATVLAVSRVGLKPVFCEPNLCNALINADLIEELIGERTRCVIPVHLYGQICDMDAVMSVAHKKGLKVLEDACQAHGAIYRSADLHSGTLPLFPECGRAGSIGDAAAFSFYPGKNLGCVGDGGCVTTCDSELASVVRSMANYGQKAKYVHCLKGFNSRLDELQAAVLRVKLRRLDADNHRRVEIARRYTAALSSPEFQPYLTVPEDVKDARNHVFHIYAVRTADRDTFQQVLSEHGVQTLIHYPCPPHLQEAYNECSTLSFPVAEQWAREELSLPISPVLTDEEVDFVIGTIKDMF
ncbi:MAG: DegT/DnrJ/EryC1/StrS family aminotransferase [Bacteroides sp.]|nr:DegT/DnrJ/EryC1/StrS family aminotransferase [Roseburia sp.]MCM1347287.1 DegT/DnrJ/EryC1/StrS family aminotransferase [Bacteroides sp.]MCM1421776.1 DegT/DnrJ/EryC1/StrS family aminotransferase [Bacteroides sp.]